MLFRGAGSTPLTEYITIEKYPAYRLYQRTTSRLLFWLPSSETVSYADQLAAERAAKADKSGASEGRGKAWKLLLCTVGIYISFIVWAWVCYFCLIDIQYECLVLMFQKGNRFCYVRVVLWQLQERVMATKYKSVKCVFVARNSSLY